MPRPSRPKFPRRGRGVARDSSPQTIRVAAAASPATRLRGISASRPRRRPRLVSAEYPRRGRGAADRTRNLHVAAEASPATRLRGLSTPRRRRRRPDPRLVIFAASAYAGLVKKSKGQGRRARSDSARRGTRSTPPPAAAAAGAAAPRARVRGRRAQTCWSRGSNRLARFAGAGSRDPSFAEIVQMPSAMH